MHTLQTEVDFVQYMRFTLHAGMLAWHIQFPSKGGGGRSPPKCARLEMYK